MSSSLFLSYPSYPKSPKQSLSLHSGNLLLRSLAPPPPIFHVLMFPPLSLSSSSFSKSSKLSLSTPLALFKACQRSDRAMDQRTNGPASLLRTRVTHVYL
mmetsp:Transcript_16156/g.27888  ORF Transcript_16156/g.27888 Transcript_16156/m.27888 type:complete len:100 (-) Transcript_16156:126-425(-)